MQAAYSRLSAGCVAQSPSSSQFGNENHGIHPRLMNEQYAEEEGGGRRAADEK